MTTDLDPEEYAANSQTQFAAAFAFINLLEIQGDEKILDVGCGDGNISSNLSRIVSGGSIYAIDSSAAMINFAKQKNIQNNLIFECLPIEDLNVIAG